MDESVEALEQALATASSRLQRRLSDEIEERRTDLDRLNRHCEQLRAEATMIEQRAKETAARIVAEARQTEAQAQAAAKQIVEEVQSRLRDRVGGYLDRAAEEISALHESLVAPLAETGAGARSVAPATRAADAGEESVVTRLTVRSALDTELRSELMERLEQLPGVYGVLFGVRDDASYELLIAHDRSANVQESILALGPTEILPTARGAGFIEVQLLNKGWLRPAVEGASHVG